MKNSCGWTGKQVNRLTGKQKSRQPVNPFARPLVYALTCFLVCLPIMFPAYAQEKDKPLKGEGIHAFLRRHNRNDNQDCQIFVKLNQGKFGKDRSLLWDVYYQLPPVAGNSNKQDERNRQETKIGHQPLFGKKYAEYTIVDQELSGACFFLSSGHGGPDHGAICLSILIDSLYFLNSLQYETGITA